MEKDKKDAFELEDVTKILEKTKKDLAEAATNTVKSEVEKEAAKKVAIEKAAEASKIQEEKEKALLEKEKMEKEKKLIEEAQKQKDNAALKESEEAKKKILEDLAKKDLEKQLAAKDEELTQMSERLKIIEDERKSRLERERFDKVNVLVNKMVKAGIVEKDNAQAKFETLDKLDDMALDEVNQLVEEQLKKPAEIISPQRETIPSKEIKKENIQDKKEAPSELTPTEIAFQKLKQLNGSRGNSNAGFFK